MGPQGTTLGFFYREENEVLTCTACEKEAPQGTKPRAGCVYGGCRGIYISMGTILALAFKHGNKVTVKGEEFVAWDILCRACMSHELWAPTIYFDCPEVQIVGTDEKHIERWGNERVITCSDCGSVLLDDALTEPVPPDDPESEPGGKYDRQDREI